MKLKNVLIVVKDIERSRKFYYDLFGLDVILDNDGNMILTEGLVLQDESIWKKFIFDSKEKIPVCEKCGKMVRPDVTLYGEFLPEEAYQNAINMMNSADCLIIDGTSLEVGSAAQLAHLFHGDHLIIINKGKTKLEGRAELVFHDSIGKVLSML
ncbi:MAG: glyoxalase [Lachnospiraceae bacterium]|nr:glyoxalase [Lachnospiraceae bacterium]